jgi:NAD(P)-dependent dehydrogenase (short-subunit alcohol dehydrogenase family)
MEQFAEAPLRRQVALVTGGGRGIGRVFARALAAAGATVAVVGRAIDDLRETARQIEAAGGRASTTVIDVADRKQADDGINRIENTVGAIDILVNNAGLWGPIDDLWNADPEEWWQTMAVHVGGSFHCCRAVLPGMVRRGAGRIISVVSNAGVYRWPTCSGYSVSKAAVIKLMENLSFETRRHGIKVFAYHPGLIAAGMGEQALNLQAPPGSPADRASSWIRSEFAAGRSVSPERAAEVLVALASGVADGLSGRYLTVFDDLQALNARAKEIAEGDLLMLRLRPLSRSFEEENDHV